ncbi:MAG: double-strand break repair protein AddB [Pseudomonadota bacterium]
MIEAAPFAPGAPKVWTIPAGEPFLQRLAETLADVAGLRKNPAALSDDLIYVPNRRSARALTIALYQAGNGVPILPPDIRALGDLETDEPPSGAEEALTDLGPALSPSRRLGALAKLVSEFYKARGDVLPLKSALAAARELTRLLDQAALAGGVDWDLLPTLVEESDLAVHWQESVDFLSILTTSWPEWLAENGASEPYERRWRVAEAISASLAVNPPKGQFVVAGSTGATSASQLLMKTAQALEGGLVVLPGLDLNVPSDTWNAIAGESDHPQHSLAGTLDALDVVPGDVPIWPGADNQRLDSRRRLVHESLAPATKTADWLTRLETLSGDRSPSDFVDDALKGLSIIEATDEAEEALLCALMLREALEQDRQTAALVTPDPAIARHVSTILKRWDVSVAPSAGVPLGRTPAGSLLLLTLKWLEDTGDPVSLLALLKHELAAFDSHTVSALERYYLRGARRWDDVHDLAERVETLTEIKNKSRHTAVPDDVARTSSTLLKRISSLAGLISPETGFADLGVLLRELTASETAAWSGADGAGAARTLDAAMEISSFFDGLDRPSLYDLVESLAGSETVQTGDQDHPRISIWGPLEARLQYADRMVLAGLNEGVWPATPSADGFLPRRFRSSLGLDPPEALLGLAAHDFAGLAAMPDVTLVYSSRREDAPTVASRWLLRLKTLVKGALADGTSEALSPSLVRNPRGWASALSDLSQTSDPRAAMPRPTPPVSARPSKLSVTRINTLQRDPYSIYSEYVLGLNKLRPLGEPVDASARGTAIHLALETFGELSVNQQHHQRLCDLVEDNLKRAGQPDHIRASERASLQAAMADFLRWWEARRDRVVNASAEARGRMCIDIAGEAFTLTGVADRIETFVDGTLSVIDFKTGGMPSKKAVNSGFEQQLPLLARMVMSGHFEALAPAQVSEIRYVGVKRQLEERIIAGGPEEVSALADTSADILKRLIEAYSNPSAPYLSIPRVQLKSDYEGDYDRLARRAEWAGELGDG